MSDVSKAHYLKSLSWSCVYLLYIDSLPDIVYTYNYSIYLALGALPRWIGEQSFIYVHIAVMEATDAAFTIWQ